MVKFHISIIPIRWYKDEILIKLDEALEKSTVLTAIEPSTNNTIPYKVDFTLQIAFSTAKMAINVALETKSDNEFFQLLKNFISSKKAIIVIYNLEMRSNDQDNIVPLQQCLIDEITEPHVTKIRGAPCKKRIKSAIEISSGKVKLQVKSIIMYGIQMKYQDNNASIYHVGDLGTIKKNVQIDVD
ncbi:hypothetical protein RhiirA1_454918 [Rhizophagus irregularis]|uniref:Uncharacterized protein n=1 Tax=Rhizophagus irregularis TaxID=588596 RepID=A0A2N0S435_9GLOM|nr:hypothetical protein RhiirA1_454918 [Rhizophagus irregularis]